MNTSASGATHTLLWLAIVLVIAWVVLRVALAVTSVALHLLWVAAIVMFVIWLINQMRRRV